ncbi:MAG: hypothetical protein MUF54_09670 [Polyangiaceae bacterium]|nr:hypothetical protein [Polyangiaceae bacterium]
MNAALEAFSGLTVREQVAIGRLRRTAMRNGLTLDELVDDLLAERATPTPPACETATALVTEVKGLLEQLASEIPAQMARQMEAALRDMASVAPGARGADTLGQLMRPAASGRPKGREVTSYREKRVPVGRLQF